VLSVVRFIWVKLGFWNFLETAWWSYMHR